MSSEDIYGLLGSSCSQVLFPSRLHTIAVDSAAILHRVVDVDATVIISSVCWCCCCCFYGVMRWPCRGELSNVSVTGTGRSMTVQFHCTVVYVDKIFVLGEIFQKIRITSEPLFILSNLRHCCKQCTTDSQFNAIGFSFFSPKSTMGVLFCMIVRYTSGN